MLNCWQCWEDKPQIVMCVKSLWMKTVTFKYDLDKVFSRCMIWQPFHFPSCDCPSIYLVISVKRQISNLQQQRIYCEDTRIIICRLVLKDGWSYKILDRAVQTVVLELTFILTNIGKMISIKAVQKQLLMWRNYSSFFMWFIFNTDLFNSWCQAVSIKSLEQ